MPESGRPVRGQREAIEAVHEAARRGEVFGADRDGSALTAEDVIRVAYPFIARAVAARVAEALRGDEAEAVRAKAIREDVPPEDALACFIESLPVERLLGDEDG